MGVWKFKVILWIYGIRTSEVPMFGRSTSARLLACLSSSKLPFVWFPPVISHSSAPQIQQWAESEAGGMEETARKWEVNSIKILDNFRKLSWIYMSHFSYVCKTERQNGISHLISKLLCTLNSSLRDRHFHVTEWTFPNSLVMQTC